MIYEMGLQEKYFNYIKNGTKRVEIRLNDEKRKVIKENDVIRFRLEPDRIEYFDTIVSSLNKYNNFNELINDIPIEKLASINTNPSELLNDLEKYYPKEKQEENGVLAITVELPEKHEKSCGIILFRKVDDIIQVLLVKHVMGHFGFPKGHVEAGETEEETAIREVKEETNVDAIIIPGFRQVNTYSPKEHTVKDVVYFVGEAKNSELNPQITEIKDVFWINIEEAYNIIRPNEVKLLKDAEEFYEN